MTKLQNDEDSKNNFDSKESEIIIKDQDRVRKEKNGNLRKDVQCKNFMRMV